MNDDLIKDINKIVWWIPIKKLRNLIRNILIQLFYILPNKLEILNSHQEMLNINQKALEDKLTNNQCELYQKINDIENVIIDCNDLYISKMIMTHLKCPDKYKSIILDIKENDVCIDGGANIGLFTKLINIQKGICYSFEPNKALYNHLVKKYSDSNNVFLYNMAISDKDEVVKFYKSDNDYNIDNKECGDDEGFSIVFKDMWDNYEYVQSIKFSKFIIENILSKYEYIYLVKLDIEGAEFDVLEDMILSEVYKNIKYIVVETHERLLEDGDAKLKRLKDMIKQMDITNIYLDWI